MVGVASALPNCDDRLTRASEPRLRVAARHASHLWCIAKRWEANDRRLIAGDRHVEPFLVARHREQPSGTCACPGPRADCQRPVRLRRCGRVIAQSGERLLSRTVS
jgi:hypothetical protein